jgi:hypothetical protein
MHNLLLSVIKLQQRLDEAGVPSVVIGGVAIAAWGEPRLTRDVDLKVQLSRQDADHLLALLSKDYQSLVSNPRESLHKHALLFIRDMTGTRLDLLLADTQFDVIAIQRGREVEVQPGYSIRLCSPEDLIIYKLISTRLRDHEDAASVVHRQKENLDDEYIIGWLGQFEQALDDSTLIAEYKNLRRGN